MQRVKEEGTFSFPHEITRGLTSRGDKRGAKKSEKINKKLLVLRGVNRLWTSCVRRSATSVKYFIFERSMLRDTFYKSIAGKDKRRISTTSAELRYKQLLGENITAKKKSFVFQTILDFLRDNGFMRYDSNLCERT